MMPKNFRSIGKRLDNSRKLRMAFVTNFLLAKLPIYRRAVATWTNPSDFAVSNRDNKKKEGAGSLHVFNAKVDFGSFWKHFYDVENEFVWFQGEWLHQSTAPIARLISANIDSGEFPTLQVIRPNKEIRRSLASCFGDIGVIDSKPHFLEDRDGRIIIEFRTTDRHAIDRAIVQIQFTLKMAVKIDRPDFTQAELCEQNNDRQS